MTRRKKQNKLKKIVNKLKKSKTKFSLSEVIIIILISIAVGALIGALMVFNKEKVIVTKIPIELEEFVSTYNDITNNYYKKINKKKLVDSAIKGMVSSLDDPYSNYMDESTTEMFNQTVDGEYKGVGITVKINKDNMEIIDIFKNSPASKKLKKQDVIIKVNDKKITSKNAQKLIKAIRECGKEEVKLTIMRNGKKKVIKLRSKMVNLPSVKSKIITNNSKKIGYIYINIFAANTYSQFRQNLLKIEKKKINSLIIDVRDNSGGYLEQVSKILELFMDDKKILYQIQNKNSIMKVYSRTSEYRKYDICVLINENSASASEILAAAIKDSYDGTLIGVNSYGKGTVQNAHSFKDGASFKYTTQKWLTPKGKWINKKGVKPDIKEEISDTYLNDPKEANDNQLQKAIEVLTNK